MATPQSNELLIKQLRTEFDQLKLDFDTLLANSTEPKDGTATTTVDLDTLIPVQNDGEDVQFITLKNAFAIMLKSLSVLNVESDVDLAGSWVFGKKTGINGGELIGFWHVDDAVSLPTSDDDFDTPFGFSQ